MSSVGTRVNALAALRLSIPAGTTKLVVNAASLIFGAGLADPGIGMYVDGAFSQVVRPTENNVVQPLLFTLDGAAHTVELWGSYQGSNNVEVAGTYISSVSAGAILANPTPARRLVVLSHSIGDGYGADVATQHGWFALCRQTYPGRASLEAWGGRSLWDDMGTGSGQLGLGSLDNLAARLVGLGFGATTLDILLDCDGTNDYYLARQLAAAYQAGLTSEINKLKVLAPAARIWVKSMLITTLESTANILGEMPPAFRTAAAAAASATSVPLIPGLGIISVGNLVDPLHPDTPGHALVAAAVRSAVGW